jgi:hypothetical protein
MQLSYFAQHLRSEVTDVPDLSTEDLQVFLWSYITPLGFKSYPNLSASSLRLAYILGFLQFISFLKFRKLLL